MDWEPQFKASKWQFSECPCIWKQSRLCHHRLSPTAVGSGCVPWLSSFGNLWKFPLRKSIHWEWFSCYFLCVHGSMFMCVQMCVHTCMCARRSQKSMPGCHSSGAMFYQWEHAFYWDLGFLVLIGWPRDSPVPCLPSPDISPHWLFKVDCGDTAQLLLI